MSSWPTGIHTVKHLLVSGSMQKVAPSRAAAQASIDAAGKHLESALAVANIDPDGAYSLLYDAARKSLAALLQVQGFRATSRGGHYAVERAIAAQFTDPPPADAFKSFGRPRRTRNQIEYDDISAINAEDVLSDVQAAEAIQAMVVQLAETMPVFTD